MSAEPSRCTMQRHKQLTLQRCKTNRASNTKHPFLITIEVYRPSEAAEIRRRSPTLSVLNAVSYRIFNICNYIFILRVRFSYSFPAPLTELVKLCLVVTHFLFCTPQMRISALRQEQPVLIKKRCVSDATPFCKHREQSLLCEYHIGKIISAVYRRLHKRYGA